MSRGGLAPGSEGAHERQQESAAQQRLPLEVENSIGMEFRLILPGEFMVGSPASENGRSGNAGERAPVDTVDWADCQSFIAALREKEAVPSGTYRLLTEAEWEYACRGEATGRFYTGEDDSDLRRVGWFDENRGGTTHPVGQKLPDAFGLHDMHGNVWEWCEDWYGSYASGDARGPRGPETGSTRVYRGSGWGRGVGGCRWARRRGNAPDGRSRNLDFRLARQLPLVTAR